MPSVEHSRTIAAPFARVWPYVRDMDNWAPLVTGYQRHEKLSDTESIWHLKGELGGLTRIAEFKALVTEWDEQGRVRFTLRGVNEPVTGEGAFEAEPLSGEADAPLPPPPRSRVFTRWREVIARFLHDRLFGRARAVPEEPAGADAETRITFRLSLNAGGMAGPILNMLIAPMLKPVAEDLANGIAARMTDGAISETEGAR